MPNDQDNAAHGADVPSREPIRRYLVKPTYEGILALSKAIRGRDSTEEEKAELRQLMAEHPLPSPKVTPES
jgi:hypothetical protein